MNHGNHIKILFRLEREDGFPPVDWESLWAKVISPGLYAIDNTPFYVRGISFGDVVAAKESDGELEFESLLLASGNSTFRVFAASPEMAMPLREAICKFGANCEGSNLPRLFSVNLPADKPLEPLLTYLKENEAREILEYEEAAIRHMGN